MAIFDRNVAMAHRAWTWHPGSNQSDEIPSEANPPDPDLVIHAGSGVIRGALAGRFLSGAIGIVPRLLAPGGYRLSALALDPFFGPFAIMNFVAENSIAVKMSPGTLRGIIAVAPAAQVAIKQSPGMLGGFDPCPVRRADVSTGAALDACRWMTGGAEKYLWTWVVSAEPLPGDNNLVVRHGLGDFFDALDAAGGATVAVV